MFQINFNQTNKQIKDLLFNNMGGFYFTFVFQDIAENVYTIPEVVSEIKDKATKERLQVLPYELIYREPSSEAVRIGNGL